MKKAIYPILFSVMLFAKCESPSEENLILSLLERDADRFGAVLSNLEKHEIQILYTQIDRDAEGKPHFTPHEFQVDPNQYFYPASTVKLPVALLALEKLNELKVEGLDKSTTMLTDSLHPWQSQRLTDETAAEGKPSVGQYIRKILTISDDGAYNQLFEFIGADYINFKLKNKGFKDSHINHRLAVRLPQVEAQWRPPIRFLDENGNEIFEQAEEKDSAFIESFKPVLKGKGYLENGELVESPMDFSRKNCFTIPELQAILKSLFFPESVQNDHRFQFSESDMDFVKKWMATLPRESGIAAYSSEKYPDGYNKFLMYGDSQQQIPDHIRIFNKVGYAYGTLTDNAYVVDFADGIEFLLTATILVNENEIFNDDRYEYESVGLPFLANLGQVIYAYEKQCERTHKPDLSHLRKLFEQKK